MMPQIPSFLENYRFEHFKKTPNSSYQFSDTGTLFKGRFATASEKRSYNITLGVEGGRDGTFIMATRMPEDIEPNDRIRFGDRLWIVQSVGYYFQDNGVLRSDLMKDEYLAARCPKGITVI